jgi:hypothetical protein
MMYVQGQAFRTPFHDLCDLGHSAGSLPSAAEGSVIRILERSGKIHKGGQWPTHYLQSNTILEQGFDRLVPLTSFLQVRGNTGNAIDLQ